MSVVPPRHPADSEIPVSPAGGEMAGLIAAYDWSRSPIGRVETWPAALRNAVSLLLPAQAQIVLFWGPESVALYNDAYAPTIGDKHPRALGRPARESWTELWDDLEPLLASVRKTGRTVHAKDRPFYIERHGYGEEVFFDISYSAVPERDGSVGGVLCIVSETTERVRAEGALRESEGRLRFMGELDEVLRTSRDAPAGMGAAAALLAVRLGASRCAYADVNADDGNDRFVIRNDYTAPGVASSVGTYSLDLFGPRAAADMHSGRTLVVRDVAGELAPAEGRDMFQAIGIDAIVCCPLVKEGRLVAMMAVHQDRPRDWRPDEVRLVEAVVERCWAHVERVGAEARLRDSEIRLQAIANSVDQMIWATKPDGYHDYYNQRWYDYTGVPEGSTDGVGWNDIFHPDDQARAWTVWRRCLETGEPYHIEYRLRHRSGEYRWVLGRAQPVRDEAGRIARWYGTCTDIHDLKTTEAALRESEERFRNMADSAPALIWACDADAKVTFANRGYEKEFGVPAERILRDGWREIVHPDDVDSFFADFLAAFGARREFQREVRVINTGGEVRWLRCAGSPRFGGEGRFLGYVGCNVDITEARLARDVLEAAVEARTAELRATEESLRQAQKMETVGQLTGGVAHDFNNLLQIVTGNLEILQRNLPEDSPRLRRSAENAMTGAKRAAILTQRLLAFSRRQPLAPKPTNPNKLVAAMSELLHRTLGETIDVETVLASGIWRVEVDPNQLENALLNLAVNARDAMPDGGKLTIETSNTHLDRGYVAQNAEVMPGQYVVICVTDTGEGMDQETVARAFEPFFTTKEVGKGTGLGLSMVYGFVKQSGGHVKVYSEPGEGTTVKVYLPRLLGAHDEEQEDGAHPLVPEGSREETILVCEDDDDVRAYSVEVLRELGYRVLEAHDGPSALRLLERQESRVDLLFTDVVLPGGLTGAAISERARALRPDLLVLFTTGYARNAIVHHGRLDPGVELITKPFTYAELAARVRDMLDGQTARG